MSGSVALEEVAAADWPALAAGFSDLGYEQDMAYAEAGARRVGARVRAFAVRRDGDPIGAACLRVKAVPGLGRGIAYLSAGPLLGRGPVEEAPDRAAAVLGALRERLVDREGHLLRLRLPVTAEGLAEADICPRASRRRTGRIPTARSHRPSSGHGGAARGATFEMALELRRAEDEGMEIVAGRDAALVERFLALYRAMREFKSFDEGFDPAFLRGMVDTAFDFEVRIARHAGKDLGGHVTAFTPACATYLFGATTEAGRGLRAGYALGWDAVAGARARGARWFDLGGVDKATNAAGHTFKIRTGGREIAALGPYEAGTRLGGSLLRVIEHLYGVLRRR